MLYAVREVLEKNRPEIPVGMGTLYKASSCLIEELLVDYEIGMFRVQRANDSIDAVAGGSGNVVLLQPVLKPSADFRVRKGDQCRSDCWGLGSVFQAGVFLCERKLEGEYEFAPFADFAFESHFSIHRFDEVLGDCQAESGSSEFTGGGGVRLGERVEQVRPGLFWNSDSGIDDGALESSEVVFFIEKTQINGYRSLGGEFHRVGYEIHHGLFHSEGVSRHEFWEIRVGE